MSGIQRILNDQDQDIKDPVIKQELLEEELSIMAHQAKVIESQTAAVQTLTHEIKEAVNVIQRQRRENERMASDLQDTLTACRNLAKNVVTARRKSHSRKRQLDDANKMVEIYKAEYKKLKTEYKEVGSFLDRCMETYNENHRMTDTENDDL